MRGEVQMACHGHPEREKERERERERERYGGMERYGDGGGNKGMLYIHMPNGDREGEQENERERERDRESVHLG